MKTRILITIATLICILNYSCKERTTGTYLANTPIYMAYEDFRAKEVTLSTARELVNPGKIWIKDQYLFINEKLEGIHVFNNSNPSAPLNLGFIEIFANTDMAVNGNILYADNYNDLLAIDITNMSEPDILCRTNDVFKFEAANVMPNYNSNLPAAGVIFEKGVITGWEQQEVTEELQRYSGFNNVDIFNAESSMGDPGATINSVSVGGSLARFTLEENHLHIIEKRELTTFSVSEECPEESSINSIWRDGETIFPANGHLFIGTSTGMLIYDLNDPGNPNFVSDYPHVAACDPVVVDGNTAYVTLRTGTRCQGAINELAVVDVTDLSNPLEIATYEMTNPHGLGVTDNILFLCDGADGLKIFNTEDESNIVENLIQHFQDITAFDVIPYQNVLLLTSAEGIYQYDYSDLNNISLLSLISVN